MAQEKAVITIALHDSTRELFKKMQFNQIPEEAQYICFLEDGNACFIEEKIEFGFGSPFPQFAFFTYYEDILVETTD